MEASIHELVKGGDILLSKLKPQVQLLVRKKLFLILIILLFSILTIPQKVQTQQIKPCVIS